MFVTLPWGSYWFISYRLDHYYAAPSLRLFPAKDYNAFLSLIITNFHFAGYKGLHPIYSKASVVFHMQKGMRGTTTGQT